MQLLKQQKGKFTSRVIVLKHSSYLEETHEAQQIPDWCSFGTVKGAAGARGKSGSPSTAPAPAIPAVLLQLLRLIGAVEESAFKELHSNDGKNEHEEHVNYEDIEDVLQGIHHAVKDSLGTEENNIKGLEEKCM